MGKIGGTAGAVALLAVVSCSLTTSLDGLSDAPSADGVLEAGAEGGGAPADASSDGGLLADVSAPTVDGCGSTGCFVMPFGFSLIAFGATAAGAPCPTGFTSGVDTVEGPTVGANACTCTCSVTAQPSCATGMIAGRFAGAGMLLCDSVGGSLANSGCGTDGYLGPFGTGNEHRFTPPPASGGSCTGAANKDATKLTYAAHGRFCQAAVIPQCAGKVCPPADAAPFHVCIGATGDVACPAGFATKHLVGDSATFNCSSGCTCGGVTAACKGKLNYFASADCSGAAGMTVQVDDACHATDAAGASYGSHAYVPFTPMNVACTKTGSTSASTAALSNAATFCCN